MNLWRRLRFLRWLAVRDLYEPNALRVTKVNRRSIAVVTGLTVLALGIAWGTRGLKLKEFEDDPLALCLWVGLPNREGEFDEPRLEAMRAALAARLGPGFREVHGFSPLREQWYKYMDGLGQLVAIAGRTLEPGDPLLDSLKSKLLAGRLFDSDESAGVIVTAGMLEELRPDLKSALAALKRRARSKVGGPAWLGQWLGRPRAADDDTGASPAEPINESDLLADLELHALGAPGQRVPVKVWAIVDVTLPFEQSFIVTAEYAKAIRALKAPLTARGVETGPVPADWPRPPILAQLDLAALPAGPTPSGLPRAALEVLKDATTFQLSEARAVARPGQTIWRLLTSAPDGLMEATWADLLDRLAKAMGGAPAEFTQRRRLIDTRRAMTTTTETGHRMAAVYLRGVAALRPAIDLFGEAPPGKPFPYPVLKEGIDQIDAIDRGSQYAFATIAALAIVLLLNGCSNMRVIQKLRSELKLTEIGMLKAMGMSSWLLWGFFVLEAGLIWLRGTLWGLALGLAVGYGIGAILSGPGALGVVLAFEWHWLFLLVPLTTWAFFTASAIAGTRPARRASPIETLRVN